MSEAEKESAFVPGGYESFPHLYQDSQQLKYLGEMILREGNLEYLIPTPTLESRVMEYGKFLQRDNLMPRARLTADRNMNHYMFELAYRDGVYGSDE